MSFGAISTTFVRLVEEPANCRFRVTRGPPLDASRPGRLKLGPSPMATAQRRGHKVPPYRTLPPIRLIHLRQRLRDVQRVGVGHALMDRQRHSGSRSGHRARVVRQRVVYLPAPTGSTTARRRAIGRPVLDVRVVHGQAHCKLALIETPSATAAARSPPSRRGCAPCQSAGTRTSRPTSPLDDLAHSHGLCPMPPPGPHQ